MTLDFIIMVLCAIRLWRARTSGGISSLLLRDGIVSLYAAKPFGALLTIYFHQAYFLAAFTSNLVQTVLAGLSLNAVMNIVSLWH